MTGTTREARERARRELAGFLRAQRAQVSPQDAGLPPGVGHRRVPGLRREEVAMLAGISVEYYARLERGNAGAVSDAVLDALVRVLRLDEVERAHLTQLTRTLAGSTAPGGAGAPGHVRPDLAAVLDLMPDAAAFVRNARLDLLAVNGLARVLYGHVLEMGDPPNLARAVFLDPRSRRFYPRWDDLAASAVGTLRAELARSPGDTALAQLLAELSEASADFRERWRGHDVARYRSGVQHFHHDLVGRLDLRYETFSVVADPGLVMIVYHAEPGSPDAERLDRLRRAYLT